MNNRELIDDLCASSPALRELHRHHLESFHTLMPHVFMGDVLSHVGGCIARGMAGGAEARAILGTLEQGMTLGDRETRNVIGISFARDAELETFFAALAPLLGPRLRVQAGIA